MEAMNVYRIQLNGSKRSRCFRLSGCASSGGGIWGATSNRRRLS